MAYGKKMMKPKKMMGKSKKMKSDIEMGCKYKIASMKMKK